MGPLAFALGTLVVGGGFLGWGARGAASASVGVLLALLNLFVLARMSKQAVRRATELGPGSAASALLAGLGAKSVVLFTVVAFTLRVARVELLPFALGLMVFVFSMLGAGLWTSLREASR